MAKRKGVILVTGATGQQGGAVARELLARKHTVRAMTRKSDGDAAKALARQGAGVEHYVYTSVGSAHRKTGIPHFDNKWRIEETVRGLDFPSYVILRPVFFMDNFLSQWFKPGIDQGKLMIGLKPT